MDDGGGGIASHPKKEVDLGFQAQRKFCWGAQAAMWTEANLKSKEDPQQSAITI